MDRVNLGNLFDVMSSRGRERASSRRPPSLISPDRGSPRLCLVAGVTGVPAFVRRRWMSSKR